MEAFFARSSRFVLATRSIACSRTETAAHAPHAGVRVCACTRDEVRLPARITHAHVHRHRSTLRPHKWRKKAWCGAQMMFCANFDPSGVASTAGVPCSSFDSVFHMPGSERNAFRNSNRIKCRAIRWVMAQFVNSTYTSLTVAKVRFRNFNPFTFT